MSDRTRAPPMTSNELRQDWQYRAGAYGWGFPGDWHGPAVEAAGEATLAEPAGGGADEGPGEGGADGGGAVVGCFETDGHLEEGRLAGAVGCDDADDADAG